MHTPPPSLQDVADLAGVSRMTASRALRDEPRCAAKTKVLVKAAALKLGYRPNPLIVARMQVMRQRHPLCSVSIAIVLPDQEDRPSDETENHRLWIRGIENRAQQLGFNTEILRLPFDPKAAQALMRTLAYRKVDGLCLLPFPDYGWKLDIDLQPFACATIGYTLNEPALHRVASNFRAGLGTALNKLSELGHQRIGLVVEAHTSGRIDHQHLEVYTRLQRYGGSSAGLLPPLLIRTGWHDEQAEKQFSEWYRKYQPDAVISNLDRPPFIKKLGLKIPASFSFASLDIQTGHSELGGIDQDHENIGACVVNLVVSQIYRNERGIPAKAELTLTPPSWRQGETILPYALEDGRDLLRIAASATEH